MDPHTLGCFGLMLALATAGPALFTAVHSRAVLAHAIAGTPRPAALPPPWRLTPTELAYLVAGPDRAAEVALVGAFLMARIRMRERSGSFTIVGPPYPYFHERDPLRHDLVATFRERTEADARRIIANVTDGRGMDWLRGDLVQAGLVGDSMEWRRAARDRAELPRTLRLRLPAAWTATAVGAVTYLVGGPAPVGFGLLAWGLASGLMLLLVAAVVQAGGGSRPLGLTECGRRVASQARSAYDLSKLAQGRDLTRDEALRYTAVSGFGELRRWLREHGGAAAGVNAWARVEARFGFGYGTGNRSGGGRDAWSGTVWYGGGPEGGAPRVGEGGERGPGEPDRPGGVADAVAGGSRGDSRYRRESDTSGDHVAFSRVGVDILCAFADLCREGR